VSKQKVLMCTGWPYASNVPHLGNFLHLLCGDAFTRYYRLKGHDVLHVSGSDTAHFTGPVALDGAIIVRPEVRLFDGIGPYAEVGLTGRLDLQMPRKPVWNLDCQFTGWMGASASKILSAEVDYDKTMLWDIPCHIANSRNHPPRIAILEPADGTVQAMGGPPVRFSATVTDPEDGDCTNTLVIWVSDLDGSIGTGCEFRYSFQNSGAHRITATVIDSNGATSSAIITITLENP